MTDEVPDLEADLGRFTPAVPPGNLADRVARQLSAPPRVWADRCLLGAIAMGLAASLAIVTLLGMDWIQGRGQWPSSSYAQTPPVLQTREFLTQLALGKDLPWPPTATHPY